MPMDLYEITANHMSGFPKQSLFSLFNLEHSCFLDTQKHIY